MRRCLALVAGGLIACSSGAALADPPIGSRIDRSARGLSGEHHPRHNASARAAVNVFLRCTASLNRAQAGKVLDQAYDSAEQVEAVGDVVPEHTFHDARREDCFSNLGSVRIGYDPMVTVGAFAEWLVDDRFDEKDRQAIAALTRQDWQWPGLVPRNASEALGMCVAEARADLIWNLVETEPDTDREAAAINALVPALGPCLAEGFEARFDAGSLRSIMAFGLYRTLDQAEELRKAQS